MEIIKKEQEIQEVPQAPQTPPADNPAGGTLKATVGDMLVFGIPGVLLYYGGEYLTDVVKANVPAAQKQAALVGTGVLKLAISGIAFWGGAKKIEKPMYKKVAYGAGTGLFVTAVTDFVDAATGA